METAQETLDRAIELKAADLKLMSAHPEYRQELLLHLDADDELIQETLGELVTERLKGGGASVGARIFELGKRGYEVAFSFEPTFFGLIVRITRLGRCWQEYIPRDHLWQVDAEIRKVFDKLVPMIGLYEEGAQDERFVEADC